MNGAERFRALSPEERIALCREVLEGLSDLVEEEASPQLCRRIEETLSQCEPYLAVRNTLKATIALSGECGQSSPLNDEDFRNCVEAVRLRMRQSPEDGSGSDG